MTDYPLKPSRSPDPRLPIPNDDPNCHCGLGHDGTVPDGMMVLAGNIGGTEVRMGLRRDCVHHGHAITLLEHGLTSRFSVGLSFPPATRAGP